MKVKKVDRVSLATDDGLEECVLLGNIANRLHCMRQVDYVTVSSARRLVELYYGTKGYTATYR